MQRAELSLEIFYSVRVCSNLFLAILVNNINL